MQAFKEFKPFNIIASTRWAEMSISMLVQNFIHPKTILLEIYKKEFLNQGMSLINYIIGSKEFQNNSNKFCLKWVKFDKINLITSFNTDFTCHYLISIEI